MATIRKKGYTYQLIVHTGKKHKYEYIRWKTGFRNMWERISEKEYNEAKNKVK